MVTLCASCTELIPKAQARPKGSQIGYMMIPLYGFKGLTGRKGDYVCDCSLCGGGPRQLDNTQRNAEDGQSHPSESTMRSRIKCNSSAISKEIKSGAQFCRTAQNDLYCTPDRKNDYNVFLSIVTSRAGLFC